MIPTDKLEQLLYEGGIHYCEGRKSKALWYYTEASKLEPDNIDVKDGIEMCTETDKMRLKRLDEIAERLMAKAEAEKIHSYELIRKWGEDSEFDIRCAMGLLVPCIDRGDFKGARRLINEIPEIVDRCIKERARLDHLIDMYHVTQPEEKKDE